MLVVVQAAPPIEKVDEPQTCPEGDGEVGLLRLVVAEVDEPAVDRGVRHRVTEKPKVRERSGMIEDEWQQRAARRGERDRRDGALHHLLVSLPALADVKDVRRGHERERNGERHSR